MKICKEELLNRINENATVHIGDVTKLKSFTAASISAIINGMPAADDWIPYKDGDKIKMPVGIVTNGYATVIRGVNSTRATIDIICMDDGVIRYTNGHKVKETITAYMFITRPRPYQG